MKESQLSGRIASLRNEAGMIGNSRIDHRALWNTVREIQGNFKDTEFSGHAQRESIWSEFQETISFMKEKLDIQRQSSVKFRENSSEILNDILRFARSATPSSEFADLILNIVTLGAKSLITKLVDLLPGEALDERKMELDGCSSSLREGWAMLSHSKMAMVGLHKKEAFNALTAAQNSLNDAWAAWKDAKNQAHEARQAAWQAGQDEWQRKRDDFVARVEANIERNEQKLDKARDALDRCRDNLNSNRGKISSDNSDSYNERVEGWISEDEDKIDSILESISRIEGWISEDRDKLRS
jgi:hypothetical protein